MIKKGIWFARVRNSLAALAESASRRSSDGVTAASPIPWREARVEVDQPAKVVAGLLPRLCSECRLCGICTYVSQKS